MSQLSPSIGIQDDHFNYESLRKATNIKKWINAALATAEKDCDTSHTLSFTSTESAVRHALSNVQFHSQQLTSQLEGHISQSITRLPRTTLELSRMISDATDLHQQMKAVESLATSSSSDSASYFSRLSELKQSQIKLQTCSTVISRAKEVDRRMKDLDNLRRAKKNQVDNRGLEDVTKLAENLYDVKSGLSDIRKVEPDFGTHFNMVLEEYEQLIQDALEEQCCMEFVAHNDEKVAALFTALYRIGRSSAVIQRFHAHQSSLIAAHICSSNRFSSSNNFSAFSHSLIVSLFEMVNIEANFWIRLSDRLQDIIKHENQNSDLKNTSNHFALDTVKELLDAVHDVVKPQLVTEVEGASCSDIIEFLHCTRDTHLDSNDMAVQPYMEEVEALLKEILVKMISDPKIIHLFIVKNAEALPHALNVEEEKSSSSMTEKISAVFANAEKQLCQSSQMVLAFFPKLTISESILLWHTTFERFILSIKISDDAEQSAVLESLSIFVRQVQPSIQTCKTTVENYITTSFSGTEDVSLLVENLNVALWEPLRIHTDSYIQKSQNTVKNWILVPLVEKTALYSALPVWRMGALHSNATYDHHTTASKPIKELGEAIIEIPVTLDSIRAAGVASASNTVWMDEVIEEFYDAWLDEIVCAAVMDFIEQKVLPLRLSGSIAPVTNVSDADSSSLCVVAWEQLRSDVGYLRNVVAAVRDNGVETLERVHDRLQRIPPPSLSNFTVQEVLFSV